MNKNVSATDEKRAKVQIPFVYSLFLSVIDIYICIYSVFSYIIRLKEKKKKKKRIQVAISVCSRWYNIGSSRSEG
jgi:hypothetical protein